MGARTSKKLRIVHFNDVYEVNEVKGKICGGAARFSTLVHSFKKDPLVCFSGDLWNPSKLSAMFHGEHLVEVVNRIGIEAAALGNHDLDLGEEQSTKLNLASKFPWLLTNVKLCNGDLIAGTKEYHIIQKGRWKVGLISIGEFDWISTLAAFDPDDIAFEDIVESSERWGQTLKEEHGCNFVIALTHMRVPNDIRLAEESHWIDLFLGGHDHIYNHQKVGENLMIKSGVDFKNLSWLSIEKRSKLTSKEKKLVPTEPIHDDNVKTGQTYVYQIKENKYIVKVIKHDITREIKPDQFLVDHIEKYNKEVEKKMGVTNAMLNHPMDTRFSMVRTREMEVGNFVTDMIKQHHHCDIGMINSGAFRADKQYPKGPLTVGDWYDMFPFDTPILKLEIMGSFLIKILENSVSKYPTFNGRFLQMSGIKFKFNPEGEAGKNRVLLKTVLVDKKPIDLKKKYLVATSEYIAEGNEDYIWFKQNADLVIDEENAPKLKQIIFEFFELADNKENLVEQEIMNAHLDVFTPEFLKKTAKKKLKDAITKLKTLSHFKSTVTGKVYEQPHKRSVGHLTFSNIAGILSSNNKLNTVICRRLKKYQLVDEVVKVPDGYGRTKSVYAISPDLENRILKKTVGN